MAELTAMVPLGGREIEMRKPSDGALVVLARVSRSLPAMIENADEIPDDVREKIIRNLGTLGKVVEGMIVKDGDKDWLDDAMIDGAVTAEEVFEAVTVAGQKINGQSGPAKKAAAPVRRRG